jgi:hypothetical protein
VSMMVKGGTPERYKAMATSEHMEWVPTSRCEKARTLGPMHLAAAWSWVARKAEVTSPCLLFVGRVLTRVGEDRSLRFERILACW